MDFLGLLGSFASSIADWATAAFGSILGFLRSLLPNLRTILNGILGIFRRAARAFKNFVDALLHGRFSEVWAEIRKAYAFFQRLVRLWNKYVQEPLDRIRRQLDLIYARIFGPILRAIDTLRVPLRILAIFNRRLAAALDRRLFGLEQKLLEPLLEAYRRLNLISSTVRAYFTRLGFLDRVLLVESIRRDASIVWGVLTNPRAVIFSPPALAPLRTVHDVHVALTDYVRDGTGDYAASIDRARDTLRRYLTELA